MLRALLNPLSWTTLRGWGNSRLARFSLAGALLVPVLGHMFAPNVGRPDPLVICGNVRIDLALPFNWMTFYLMTLAFAFAEGLYLWRCPAVVRRFATFSDYRAHHYGVTHLVRVVADLVHVMPVPDLERFHRFLKVALRIDGDRAAHGDQLLEEAAALPDSDNRARLFAWYQDLLFAEHHEGLLSDTFDVIHDHAGRLNRISILLSGVLFRVGLVLLVLVIIQALVSVCRLAAAGDAGLWGLLTG
ncbi:MAG: hypothetical protein GXY55_09145 [Phycisphaerae bacterium]|nr:hypothetical protein [Phycisphaerae bacterium]